MTYAIIEFAGKQVIIEPNQEITVDGQWGTVGESINLDKVLALNDAKLEFGTPLLKTPLKAMVKAHKKGEKIHVRTFKSKSRYRRHIGYRSQQTVLTIEAFGTVSKKTTVKAAKTKS